MYVPHYKLVFGGTLCGTEQWSCSLNLATSPYNAWPVGFDLDAHFADAVSDLGQWLQRADSKIGGASLTQIKLNKIDANGRYEDPNHPHTKAYAGINSSPSVLLAPQCAVVVTLLTAKARGAGAKGRFFTPALLAAVEGDGRMSLATATAIATSAKTLINDLNNWPGVDFLGDLRVVVATQGTAGDPGAENVPVTGVAVGRVVDTHRSRRASLDEQHVKLDL